MKYYEVAIWYVQQHRLMFIVLGLCIVAISLMYYAAKQYDECVTHVPEYEDKE